MSTVRNGRGSLAPANESSRTWIFSGYFSCFRRFQPIIKQKLLEASRKRLITLIERERKSRVVLLVHRQETMSLLGFPLFRYIDINDSEEVIRAIHLTDPEIPLDLVLHTPGGLVLAATQIARAVSKHKGKVTVFVPHSRDLGLRVTSDMPENMLRLMQLYPQPTRRQSSVEYVPLPYRTGRRASRDGD